MMHGMWDFLAMKSMIEEANRTDFQTAPIFKWEDWKQTVPHGIIMCGHIHSRHVYKNHIFYPGSFSAWDFTDISEKGFAYYTYDTEKKFYRVKFINNTKCPTYGTITLNDLGLDLNECSIEDFQEAVKLESEKYDNFRIDIDTDKMPLEKTELIKKIYKDNPKIKVKILEKKILLLEEDKDKYSKYEYIFKNTLPIEEVIYKYINEEMSNIEGHDKITVDQIKEIITVDEE